MFGGQNNIFGYGGFLLLLLTCHNSKTCVYLVKHAQKIGHEWILWGRFGKRGKGLEPWFALYRGCAERQRMTQKKGSLLPGCLLRKHVDPEPLDVSDTQDSRTNIIYIIPFPDLWSTRVNPNPKKSWRSGKYDSQKCQLFTQLGFSHCWHWL